MPRSTLTHATPISVSVAGLTTVETVIATSDFEPTNVGGEGYLVAAEVNNILSNASASTGRIRIRQNSLTGTVVADSGAGTFAAGSNGGVSCVGVDANPAPQYVCTLQMSATAQAGTSTGALLVQFASSASD